MPNPRRNRDALIIVILILAMFLVWRGRRAQPFDQPTVVAQVRELNQLATVRFTLQRVVSLTEQKQPVGSETILLIVQATVDAGVNLAALRPDDVIRRPDGAVVIRLPAATILNLALDEKQTKVWDRQKTWWTPWVAYSRDLEHNARLSGLDSAQKAALEMGILDQAQRNAETAIRSLLKLVGVQTVVFVRAT